jgi:hypothetical protein
LVLYVENGLLKLQYSSDRAFDGTESAEPLPAGKRQQRRMTLNEGTQATGFQPVRRHWEPEDLFAGLDRSKLPDPAGQTEARRAKLWKDLYVEYDARQLQAEVDRRGLAKTDEAKAFLAAWDADEKRHTRGFIQIMELVADSTAAELWEALGARKADFKVLDPYLSDEFSICVIIAFDEMVTCHAYAEDREFYETLGSDAFIVWLRELMADEAAHCHNAINVIRTRHTHRIPEVEALLHGIAKAIPDASGYGGTFVMDYFGDDYTQGMIDRCRESVQRAITRGGI